MWHGATEVVGELELRLPVKIRRCEREDLRQLEWFGLFAAHRPLFRRAWRRHLRGNNVMLVADLRGHPIGQVWVDLARRRRARTGFIWALRVLPVFQGLGIGRRLLEAAEQVIREAGCDAAEISVEKKNRAALALYARSGYRREGELRETYGYTTPDGVDVEHEIDEWLLRKPLVDPVR